MAGKALDPYEAVPNHIQAMLADEEGPVMVTTWVVLAEYIGENGSPGFAAWSSDDPPWRVQGLMAHGADLLDLALHVDYEDEEAEEE